MARLLERYRNEVVPEVMKVLGYRNPLEVPRLTKIVVSMGVGAAAHEAALAEDAAKELSLIAGQKAVVTRSRRAIAGFKLRRGMPVGCRVTLRDRRMYEFLDRLIHVAIPRIRDFRGLDPEAFDGRGSYSLGITEQIVFPEVDIDAVKRTQGMNITIVTNAGEDGPAREILRRLGMPFAESKG